MEAYNVTFLQNKKWEVLLEDANTLEKLYGYIKIINNEKLFVKHVSTYIFIPLEISDWEVDIEKNYFNRENQLVAFKLAQTKKANRPKAAIIEKSFCDEYYIIKSALENDTELQVTVTGKNPKGIFVTILNGRIEGFILINNNASEIVLSKFRKLKRGNITYAKVIQISLTKRVLLNLTDSIF